MSENKRIRKQKRLRWEKLDNTAHLFPVIADSDMTNVYRISVILKEEIQPELLQKALDKVLPKMDGFNMRLRKGIFWYYFEENVKPAPRVRQENDYPCRYIVQNQNSSYLFRVTYYKCRINLEVFHVLADGMGGINFLKELAYQYLRLSHPEVLGHGEALSGDTSLNREDSFIRNYRRSQPKGYKTQKAFRIKGEKLQKGQFGVIHGKMNTQALKQVAKGYGLSINEYLVTAFVFAVYQAYHRGKPGQKPIRVAVPVNLRPYFGSVTTKNFFVMVSAEFAPEEGRVYDFAQVGEIVQNSLKTQITREHLEDLFSYNVSNQMNMMARTVPLFLKNMGIRMVYTSAALANTSTVTNIGNISVEEPYGEYIEDFHAMLAMSKGQSLKGTISSYGETLTFTFSSILAEPLVQRCFFRLLAGDGLEVTIESNGVYYGEM